MKQNKLTLKSIKQDQVRLFFAMFMLILMENERFEFSFRGQDEGEEVNGYGWIKLKTKNEIDGELRFLQGDDSTFNAIKMEIT